MLHSTMLPITTEQSFTACFCPKYGVVVPQLLSPLIWQTYSPTHQFGGHGVHLEWNRVKSILDAEEFVANQPEPASCGVWECDQFTWVCRKGVPGGTEQLFVNNDSITAGVSSRYL